MNLNYHGQGIITLPGSKSVAIRTLIIAGYLDKPIRLTNFPLCGDTETLLEALNQLGSSSKISQDKTVIIKPSSIINYSPELYVQDSAAALRFLLVRMAGIAGLEARVKLSQQLLNRPIEPLLEIIRSLGADAVLTDQTILLKGREQLKFTAKTQLLIEQYQEVSSQFISALLLNSPLFPEGISLRVPSKQVSHPYLKLTTGMMKDFGIEFSADQTQLIAVKPDQKYCRNTGEYRIEEDYSSAAYFWALGALSNNPIVTPVSRNHSLQGDREFISLLTQMGGKVKVSDESVSVQKGRLRGLKISMRDMPDQVPTLAVLALFADNRTIIEGIGHLRHKESDRIDALCREFTKLGADISYSNNQLIINPLKQPPAKVLLDTHNDHRLVMSFSILREVFPQLELNDTKAVAKSFPDFFLSLTELTKITEKI